MKSRRTASGITDPHLQIAEWSRTVTEMYNSLTEDKKGEYVILTDQWNKDGPPLGIKQWSVL